MSGSTIDHMVSVMVFLGAILVFISLFNQNLQTAVLYQQHRSIATKTSDVLDNILLNPGIPSNWGESNLTPTGLGLQDPEFVQYRLSAFSLMRLHSSGGEPVYYPKTGKVYSNITQGMGFLLIPQTNTLNYSTASKLLGINGSYGFELTLTPTITVSISEVRAKNPLRIEVKVAGTGFPLSNAQVSYCLLTVSLSGQGAYPAYEVAYGDASTDEKGEAILDFTEITDDKVCYAFIAYARLHGLMGVGYHERVTSDEQYVIPFIDDIATRRVLIAHSFDVHYFGPPVAEIAYNATFVVLTEDFTLREMPLENGLGKVGKVNYGEGHPYGNITIPTRNPGILVITYRKSAVEGGVVLMPWGISAMAFPVTFGGNPLNVDWVSTDIRQVTVNDIVYQAKLGMWSLEGYQVIGR